MAGEGDPGSGESHIRIEQLFNTSWARRDEKGSLRLKALLLLLYTPIGIILFLARLGILFQFFLLKELLPESAFKRNAIRVMGSVLGVTVSTEGEVVGSTEIYVANHVTVLDPFVIHLLTHSLLQAETAERSVPRWMDSFLGLRRETDGSFSRLFFPEGTTTNGARGLLAFSDIGGVEEGTMVQPIALQVSRPFLNVNSIQSGPRLELFLTLFLPNTHYTLRFLPLEAWESGRVQKIIASTLALHPTKFRAKDKEDYVKQLNYRPPSLASQARLVQQKLHPITISPESVLQALQKTGSVDEAVKELRDSFAQPQFRKSASERMISFQERKRLMIQNARINYAKKNGVKLD